MKPPLKFGDVEWVGFGLIENEPDRLRRARAMWKTIDPPRRRLSDYEFAMPRDGRGGTTNEVVMMKALPRPSAEERADPCDECEGVGRVECYECDGFGSETCDLDHDHECRTCDATGSTTCRACDGSGESETTGGNR